VREGSICVVKLPLIDLGNLLRMRKRRPPIQHRVDQTEDCRVRADSEGEGHDRYDGEADTLARAAKGEAKIGDETFHAALLGGRGRVGWRCGGSPYGDAGPGDSLATFPGGGQVRRTSSQSRCFVIRHDSPRSPCASPPVSRPHSRSSNRDTPTLSLRPRKRTAG